ncbi:LacI family DNA-binding transcriptional regulator [Shimia sp.]|uniref:LacI family DNA-binding transcriptional regulator n=1 Tax=Shimia sp. TaxID=1954381 RepID=UPI0032977F31
MDSPTLSDVARAAGVSYATADRVINKRGNVAEKSMRKVQEAVASLGYVRNVAAANLSRGRTYRLAFLIPAGSNAFFNRMRQHLSATAQHFASDRVSVEIIEIAAFAISGLHDSLVSLVDENFDGAAIVGLQGGALEAPLKQLRDKGIAIIGLVSDLPEEYRSAYIGIDNTVAGRTAARLIGMSHAGRKGLVQTFAGSLDAQDHDERLAGFREVIDADYPQIDLLETVMTKDDAAIVRAQTETQLEVQSELTAIYNVGAGNSGLIAALHHRQQFKPFCVVHELVPHTRRALLEGHVDLVIDQRPDVEINRAFAVLRSLIDQQPLPPLPDLVPTIYVRDNLPADTTDSTMKDQNP